MHHLPAMSRIIRPSDDPPALPDFRNLGTVLRVLVGVNAAALVIALAREPRLAGIADQWAAISGYVEPQLFAEVLFLWIIAPWLTRATWTAGATAIAVITVACAVVVHVLLGRLTFDSGGTWHGTAGFGWPMLRHVVFALLAQFALLGYFRLRARALSPAITESRLAALQARIRPHFLFNSITAVLSLMRREPRRAETALEDLAELFRVLMRDNRELIPLADEVALCRQYLDLEQLRLGERLIVDWNLKSMPADAMVPPLVVQPLLENAVYHGIEPSTTPGVISINIFQSREEVHAVLRNPWLADDGRHRSGNRMALANIRERLALHFDAEASLDSRVTRDGYEVHIRMPYRTEKPIVAPNPRNGQMRREPYVGNADEKRREAPTLRALPALKAAKVSHG
ncbi:MAG TPA: histidine kinase [Casimicrobiaceae bacterium]|nr:histidine kinase [Casimicrobiaceae bacterium]